ERRSRNSVRRSAEDSGTDTRSESPGSGLDAGEICNISSTYKERRPRERNGGSSELHSYRADVHRIGTGNAKSLREFDGTKKVAFDPGSLETGSQFRQLPKIFLSDAQPR